MTDLAPFKCPNQFSAVVINKKKELFGCEKTITIRLKDQIEPH